MTRLGNSSPSIIEQPLPLGTFYTTRELITYREKRKETGPIDFDYHGRLYFCTRLSYLAIDE